MQVWHVILLVLVGIAAVIDLRTRRIPNALSLGGVAGAFAYHTWVNGLSGLGQSAGGWAVGIALFMPMYLLKGMGAGDVKLLGMVGAWLGPLGALYSALYSAIAGGVLALAVGAAHGYLGEAFRNLWVLLGFWRASGPRHLPGLTLADARGPRLAYGVAIAAGTAAVVLLRK